MLNIVIDTNVVVSAALSPLGNPAKIIELIINNEEIQVYYCDEIITEYKEVLSRDYVKITQETQNAIITAIIAIGILIAPSRSEDSMLDEDDRVFYDTAKTIGAVLITGNTKHYPAESFIMTPANFLKLIESK